MERTFTMSRVIILLVLSAVVFGCGGPANTANSPSSPTKPNTKSAATPTPLTVNQNTNTNDNSVVATQVGFSAANICGLPQTAAAGSGFAALGGGTWGSWDDAGGELGYACNGGTDSVKLEEVVAKISGYYTALGDANSVHRVSVKYVALQYGGKAPMEPALRQQYVKFCEALATRFYGTAFSEKFKTDLSDESRYSPTGKPAESFDKPGGGYVVLRTTSTKQGMMTLETIYYQNEAEFKKFKDL